MIIRLLTGLNVFFSRAISTVAGLVTFTMISSLLLSTPTELLAYPVDQCAGDRFGSDLVCTAGDVSITGISVAPGTPTACVGGSTFNANLDITVNFATPDRWDVGIFLSNDGGDPQLLSTTTGGAATCSVGILPTSSPFLDLDPNGGADTCGDGNGTIGGTGSGVVRFYNVPVQCKAIASSGGNLYIPFVVSWDNQSSPSGADCTSNLDPVPNTKSKCNAPNVSNPVEVLYGTVDAVVLPDVTKTDGVTSVNPGGSLTYTVTITNSTGQPLNNAVFTDPATANLTVNSVSCSASGGATCPTTTIAGMQGAGLTLPSMPVDSILTFTIGATVANPVSPSHSHQIVNTANVTVQTETNSATDTDAIIGAVYADLSTSTKTVVDLNGGEADPGDTLRYTITLIESAGQPITGVSVTDDIPPYVNTFTVISTPTGSTDSSTGAGTGANGNGYLNVTGINIPANGSVTIVFDVTIAAGTPAGTTIDNFATVTNPGGPGGTPSAPTIIVSPSAVPVTDNKKLYMYNSATLSRYVPTSVTPSSTTLKNSSASWPATSPVSLQQDNVVQSAYATLLLSADSAQSRKIEARMYCSSNASAYATSGTYDLGTVPGTPTPYTFNLTTLVGGFTFPATCTSGNHWVLRVDSHDNKNTFVTGMSGVNHSRLNLDSSNVIYVESLDFYNAAYNGGSTTATFVPGNTVYIRSVVSDPFGSFDISSALVDITDPDGNPVVVGATMSMVNDTGIAEKTFEYAYPVLPGATSGNWTVKVTANEGSEGTVTDDQTSSFEVSSPNLSFLKLSVVERDPVNGTSNPQAIPGSDILYTLQVANSGSGTPDYNSVVIVDPIPTNAMLYVNDLGGGSPVLFSDSDSDSGYTPPQPFTLSYSDRASCGTYSYSPLADTDGFDADVCRLRVQMNGTMSGATTTVTPDFDLQFRTRIQ